MRTLHLNDRQSDNLYHILRKEFFAGYTTSKEKIAADELYMILTNARHEPDTSEQEQTENWQPSLFKFAPPEARETPDGWREVEA